MGQYVTSGKGKRYVYSPCGLPDFGDLRNILIDCVYSSYIQSLVSNVEVASKVFFFLLKSSPMRKLPKNAHTATHQTASLLNSGQWDA
jgi:hypothetical protein